MIFTKHSVNCHCVVRCCELVWFCVLSCEPLSVDCTIIETLTDKVSNAVYTGMCICCEGVTWVSLSAAWLTRLEWQNLGELGEMQPDKQTEKLSTWFIYWCFLHLSCRGCGLHEQCLEANVSAADLCNEVCCTYICVPTAVQQCSKQDGL